jgi:hypothetical protein
MRRIPIKQTMTIDYICDNLGVSATTVNNRAKVIFNKRFYQLNETERLQLAEIFFYDYNKDLPKVTLRHIADISMKLCYIALTAKFMQVQDSLKNGLYHEIEQTLPFTDMMKMFNVLYTDRFGKTIEDEFQDGFKPELLLMPNDYMTEVKQEYDRKNDKLDGQPETGA